MQPHLRKCFDNINKINFETASDIFMTEMISAEPEIEPESVIFHERIKVMLTEKVENWLSTV